MFLLPASLRTPGISLFFAIARSDMRCLDTPCYATACARTVRIMHGWGGGWGEGGWAWLHALSCHTCWMLQNCTYMFRATQLHVLVLFVSCTDGVGGVFLLSVQHGGEYTSTVFGYI